MRRSLEAVISGGSRYCMLELIKEEKSSASPDQHQLAEYYTNLGTLYLRQQKYTDAESTFSSALAIHRQTLPANHPTLAITESNLAATCIHLNKLDQARQLLEEA